MKRFLTQLNEVIKCLEVDEKISDSTGGLLKSEYQKCSEHEKEECIQIVAEIMSDNYYVLIYFLSFLFDILQDKKWLFQIDRILISRKYPLWARLNDRKQYSSCLFRNAAYYEEVNEYKKYNDMYQNILKELQEQMQETFPYIPYVQRSRSIILIVSQLLWNETHAPSKRLKYIYYCYKNMGYDVKCFVCYFKGDEGNWYQKQRFNNFMDYTDFFQFDLNEIKLEGYNLTLHAADYIERLKQAVRMIWDIKPEFILEIGDQTLLAGLCSQFTTLVTMGCTSNIPITNAAIIATAVDFSEEDWKYKRNILDDDQVFLEVKHNIHDLDLKQSKNAGYTKETFGIPENFFTIIIAGNRLDSEISDSFIDIMYQILDMDDCFVIAIIGACPELQERVLNDQRRKHIVFLGPQKKFRETLAIGDVFLNPPRQGGGTGALFAVMEEVPVITLDHCDVEANAGQDFVCKSIEEMPELVLRYYKDKEFMKIQKENCRKRAAERTNLDGEKSFQMLRHVVKEYVMQREEDKNAAI